MDGFNAELLRHYENVWGTAAAEIVWIKRRPELPDFRITVFPPRPTRPVWTYATSGMSHAASPGTELHLFSPVETVLHAELLTAIAAYHRNDTQLRIGHTVNFGRAWLPGSICEFGLISLPYLDGPRLERFRWHDSELGCYWLIPITKAERDFKAKRGLEALESVFDSRQIDYANPERRSLI